LNGDFVVCVGEATQEQVIDVECDSICHCLCGFFGDGGAIEDNMVLVGCAWGGDV
jgi:hypothetical protein